MRYLILSAAAIIGLSIGWVDSRPAWDDAGITAMALLSTSAIFGMLGRTRPWRWAILIGIWVPLIEIARSGNFGSLLALVFTFVGAYGGALLRRLLEQNKNPGDFGRPLQ
jgi:hypothetical protein